MVLFAFSNLDSNQSQVVSLGLKIVLLTIKD